MCQNQHLLQYSKIDVSHGNNIAMLFLMGLLSNVNGTELSLL